MPSVNRRASSMLCKTSISPPEESLKGIDALFQGRRKHIGTKPRFISDVHLFGKHVLNEEHQIDVIVHARNAVFVQFDQDVDIALRPVIPPSDRAEQGGMDDSALAQRVLVLP